MDISHHAKIMLAGFSTLNIPHCQVTPTSHTDSHRTELRLDRFDLTLLEIPGGQKARATWRLYYSQAYALVFVVDASDPGRLKEVACVLANVLRHPRIAGKPLLILANKQDKSCALLPSEIIELLSLETLVNENKTLCRIEPCSAGTDFHSHHDWAILKGLRWVLRSVALSYPTLSARVLQESSKQKDSLCSDIRVPSKMHDDRAVPGWDVLQENITDLVEYKPFPGGKNRHLKPIQNILKQTGHSLSTVKKRRRKVKVKESGQPQITKEDEDEKEVEGKKWGSEHKLISSSAKQTSLLLRVGHSTVTPPDEQHGDQGIGSRKRKKKRKAAQKNQIKSSETGASTGDMANTFDLYRRAMQALKQKQEQQRAHPVCKNQDNNPLH
ncbi:ADP-ribosylation factor-like protein 13A isoform 2-T2 [Rhinophrynus dorsalis]